MDDRHDDRREIKRFDLPTFLKTKFESFLSISQEQMESESLVQKAMHFRELLDGDLKNNRWGLLDLATLWIPRLFRMGAVSIQSNEKFCAKYPLLSKALISGGYFLFYLQRLLGFIVVVLCSPLVLVVDFFYPKKKHPDIVPLERGAVSFDARGRDRRRLFFNPSTSMLLFLLITVISLILQAYFPANLAQAAVALGIMQAVFASMAVLTLVTAVYLLATESPPKYSGLVEKDGGHIKNYTHLGIRGYFREMQAWFYKNPMTLRTLTALAIAGLMVALIFTIGHFACPGFFDFLEPFFDAFSQAFTAISQAMSGLPGLDFLSTMPEATAFVVSQVLGVLTFFLIAIFVPDTLRRIIQTIQGTPEVSKEYPSDEDLASKTVTLFAADDLKTSDGESFAAQGEALTLISYRSYKTNNYLLKVTNNDEKRASFPAENFTLKLTIVKDDTSPRVTDSPSEPIIATAGQNVWVTPFYFETRNCSDNNLWVWTSESGRSRALISSDHTDYQKQMNLISRKSAKIVNEANSSDFYESPFQSSTTEASGSSDESLNSDDAPTP